MDQMITSRPTAHQENYRVEKEKAILFDLDGVLVLTESLKALAHTATVKRFGGDIPISFYRDLMGQSHEAVRGAFIKASSINIDPVTYTQTFRETYQELLRNDLKTTPGAEELVRQLAEAGYLMAVVSSTRKKTMEGILSSTGLARFFSAFVGSDDVDKKKPAPDAYLLALRMLDVLPDSAVVIEDSESGVNAAHNAGLRVLALRHQFNASHDFTHASVIVDSLLDTQFTVRLITLLTTPVAANTCSNFARFAWLIGVIGSR